MLARTCGAFFWYRSGTPAAIIQRRYYTSSRTRGDIICEDGDGCLLSLFLHARRVPSVYVVHIYLTRWCHL